MIRDVRAEGGAEPDHQWAALAVTMLGVASFAVLAIVLVPWNPTAGLDVQPVPAAEVFSAAEIERAENFRFWARAWSWSSLAVALAVACWLGFGRTGRRLAAVTRGPWWFRAATVVAALVIIGRLVTLPFAFALRRLQLDEGLATSSWAAWSLDLLKAQLVAIALTGLAVVVLLGCARRWRRVWPAIAGGLLAALVVLGSFLHPLLVEPLFHDFEPLPAGELRTDILTIAEQQDVQIEEILVADASRRTTTLNAWVSGFGQTRRVVVYDTLVEDLEHEEALAVVAHELAHARYGDVVTGTALGAAGALVGVGLLGVVVGALSRRGRPPIRDVRAVPLLLALVAVGSLASAPIENGISRAIETRADVVALDATAGRAGHAEAFVEMQRRLALRSLADPEPPRWAHWWFGSHPTVLERIAVAEAARSGATAE